MPVSNPLTISGDSFSLLTVTELMSKKPINSQKSPGKHHSNLKSKMVFKDRDGLGAYTADPFAHERVIFNNDTSVIIQDNNHGYRPETRTSRQMCFLQVVIG